MLRIAERLVSRVMSSSAYPAAAATAWLAVARAWVPGREAMVCAEAAS